MKKKPETKAWGLFNKISDKLANITFSSKEDAGFNKLKGEEIVRVVIRLEESQ